MATSIVGMLFIVLLGQRCMSEW